MTSLNDTGLTLVQRMRLLTEEMRKNSARIESIQTEIQFAHRARDVLLKQIDLGQKVATAIEDRDARNKADQHGDGCAADRGEEDIADDDPEGIVDLQAQLAKTELELASINIEKSLSMVGTAIEEEDGLAFNANNGYSIREPRLLPKDKCLVSGRSGYAGSGGFPDERTERHYVIESQPLVLGASVNLSDGLQPLFASAIFGFGCFWCAESIFWQKALLPGVGVLSTQVGYCGGETAFPTYSEVCSGRTNHAEVVRVQFDPRKIRYTDLLRYFWLSHDPTKYARQGNDVGTQYRSIIVCESDTNLREAKRSRDAFQRGLEKWDAEKRAGGKGKGDDIRIKTEIVSASEGAYPFYLAERKHQQYEAKPGGREYCGLKPLAIPLGYVDDV
mmetsp:Transcript_18068/g.45262  ORF Transcript_18068/g.45262 Transcript_18068/m.45262 type:complete len:389 (+) Transcript_18068:439-1605(+)|eukprot:CAMPEP_0178984430 /NCGR_PEP_ID=MMETSP0795-20121207/1599_1 /TAXON_ID=88552 /ORGANISM="Amoebophrya sp., Strain Ameob2" /LENGTH=388 /DNA_ID=CAMNT_0020675289 /DNA_START=418 /DNA_END=1584 /DNA_ORIENTATION=+